MNARDTTLPDWEKLRTSESRHVEELLRGHFQQVDAYRYNSGSLRVRIIDPRFQDLPDDRRDDLVDPVIAQLHESTQADIMNLVLLYPGETEHSVTALMQNLEFESPAPSML